MHVYIIGTVRDIRNENKVTDYLLLDTDDSNKTMQVTKNQLFSVMKAKKMKIYNAKLSADRIQGTQYALSKLPFMCRGILYNSGLIILEVENQTCKLCCLENPYDIKVASMTLNNVLDIKNHQIVNAEILNSIKINSNTGRRQFIKPTNSVRDLDKEAYDPTIIWSLEDFTNFMRKHNWAFIVRNCVGGITIFGISPECNIVHLPENTQKIFNLFLEKPKKPITIIFNSEVSSISSIYDDQPSGRRLIEDLTERDESGSINPKIELVDVENIYFQTSTKKQLGLFDAMGLRGLNILGKAELPNSDIISNIYNMSIISEYKENIDKIRRLDNCFNFTSFKNSVLNINIMELYRSFCNVGNYHKLNSYKPCNISLGNRIERISGSFKCIDATNIDFNELVSLTAIDSSFYMINTITDVDLSNSIKLSSIAKSFKFCENIRSFKLKSVIYLYESFVESPIAEIEIPSNINTIRHRIGMHDCTKLIMPENITEITHNLMWELCEGESIEYKGKVTKISSGAFSNTAYGKWTGLKELYIPDTIETLETEAFFASGLEKFDSALLPKLSAIPERCFAGAKNLQTVIFGDNINSIDKEVLDGCITLQNVVISNKVINISTSAFTNIKSPAVRFIVIRDSKAHKMLAKKSYMVVIVNSMTEALELVSDEGKTKKEKQGKFMIALAGTEYEELLQDEYIKDISFSLKFLKTLKEACNNEITKIPQVEGMLDTSKFRELDITKIQEINRIYSSFVKVFNENMNEPGVDITDTDPNKHNLKFCNLCNLITKIYDNDDRFYTESCISDFDMTNMISMAIPFSDGKDAIIEINTTVFNNKLTFICIIVNSKIEFMTLGKLDYISKFSSPKAFNISMNPVIGKVNLAISDYFIEGDIIAKTCYNNEINILRIQNATIPFSYYETIMEYLEKELVIIGVDTNNIDTSTRNREKKLQTLIFYSIVSGKVIKAQCRIEFEYQGSNLVRRLRCFGIKEIKRLQDIDIEKSHYFDFYKNYSTRNIEDDTVNLMALSQNEIKEKYSDMNNYDIDGDTTLCELADYIYDNGIDSIKALNEQALRNLVKSSLFTESTYTLKEVQDNVSKGMSKIELVRPLTNGDTFIIYTYDRIDSISTHYKDVAYHLVLAGIISGSTPMNKKGVLRLTYMPVKDIVKNLFTIGYTRKCCDYTPDNGISNNKINIDKYMCTNTLTTSGFEQDGIKIHVAFDKTNADVYTILDSWDSDFYSIFRFKKYSDAIDFVVKTNYQHTHSFFNFARYFDNRYGEYKPEECISLHEMIMNGFPNNFPYMGKMKDLANKLKKQPKK